MSYAIYSTRGFILGSVPSGEASRVYSVYTEDFGLIRAKAQSVRLLSSKLRYNLDDYSFGTFSLVRGKEVWRVTGADMISQSSEKTLRARILSLIRRLVNGEERNDELWKALVGLTDAKTSADETKVLSHILSSLGYLDLKSLDRATDREVLSSINKALKETQL
jgi:recombinational DNA repair protein (RecF pathway)